ncbi:DUF4157 domain-containing protein [uncultured Aquimarina sp.]|uniref:eCIS core domain-containing protein n=1 Tax=uncultured Aquimarina sp. TaxID=575652 RepID=UPI0026228653|nr:DUF4157 domain-containing protein [uncultured Aquimarina sp.]
MKAPQENTQEPQKDTVQRVQQESSTGGEATIADNRPAIAVQRKLRSGIGGTEDTTNPIQLKNSTGLPDNLKSGIENLSGYSMDDVKVHYNSSKPAQLQAHAYAQGTDIHLASGQEKHLPHEAWHVVQQKQGRVMPTMQFKGKVNVNDDAGLEREADVMGEKAICPSSVKNIEKNISNTVANRSTTLQLKRYVLRDTDELNIIKFVNNLQRLKHKPEYQQIKDGKVINDTIPYEHIVDGQHYMVVDAFDCYLTGKKADNIYVAAFLKKLSRLLNIVYGVNVHGRIITKNKFNRAQASNKIIEGGYTAGDGENRLKKRVKITNTNPGGTRFNTKGIALEDADTSTVVSPYGSMLRQFIAQAITTKDHSKTDIEATTEAEDYFPNLYKEWIESGTDVPDIVNVSAGTEFYKLMGPGKSYIDSWSAYYLDTETYDKVKSNGGFMDLLGLPSFSYEAVYAVYKIKALVDTRVYSSEIAPTISKAGRRRKSGVNIYSNNGGLTQVLIVNSRDTDVWDKISTPFEILDPYEQAVQSLMETKTETRRMMDINNRENDLLLTD